MELVSQGDRGALDLAAAIAPFTDGAYTEELYDSLFLALGEDPERVLSLSARADFPSLEGACSGLLTNELERPPCRERVVILIRDRKRAVRGVRTPALTEARGRCLVELRRFSQKIKDLTTCGRRLRTLPADRLLPNPRLQQPAVARNVGRHSTGVLRTNAAAAEPPSC